MRIRISNSTDFDKRLKYNSIEIDVSRDLANIEDLIKKLDIECDEMDLEINLER